VSNEIAEIGNLIRTQDNRITDQPIFIVEKEVTEWGYSPDHTDDYMWINAPNDYAEATEEESEKLDVLEDEGGDVGDWEKHYYRKRWEFVTPCFTESGCKEFIVRNGHNLGVTRIYACGSYRNNEWQTVRKHLMEPTQDKGSDV